MKACPYCAESDLQDDAVVCKHCGKDIGPGHRAKAVGEQLQQIGCGLTLLITIPIRLIVITDEQSHDSVPGPNGLGYVINVASYKPGVGYGAWRHIDGWSDRVLDYIRAVEADEREAA